MSRLCLFMAWVFVGGLCCVVMTTWCPQAPRRGRRAAPAAAAVRCHRGARRCAIAKHHGLGCVVLSPYVVPLCLVCLGCVLFVGRVCYVLCV